MKTSRLFLESLSINIAQSVHMAIMVIAVPVFIGVSEYGKFAALFAVPGVFQSISEMSAIVLMRPNTSRHDSTRYYWVAFGVLAVLLAGVTALFLDPLPALLVALLILVFLVRSYLFADVMMRGMSARAIVPAELTNALIYLSVLGVAYLEQGRSYLLPLVMVLLGGSASIAVFLLLRRFGPRPAAPAAAGTGAGRGGPVREIFRAISSKVFEDGFITLPPMALNAALGSEVAGMFRIFVAFVKAVYKLFPLRHDIVIREISHGRFRYARFMLLAAAFLVLTPTVLFVVLNAFQLADALRFWQVILCSGVIVVLLVLYPASAILDFRVSIVALVASAGLFAAPFLFGAQVFLVGFSAAALLILALCLRILSRAPTLGSAPVR